MAPLGSRLASGLQWWASASALAYAGALFLSNLLQWPAKASVRDWPGAELAIRYCAGFVRRGLLGQVAWWGSGWLGRQEAYVALLALAMAGATLGLGLWMARLLRRACGWRLGLLVLAAPVGWPVLMTHGAVLFRKDAAQILLGGLLLLIWSQRIRGRPRSASSLAWLAIAAIQIAAVFIHEPFALLILPAFALALHRQTNHLSLSLAAVAPGLSALAIAILHKGSPLDVACLQADLHRLGLLAAGEGPGSSILELARSKPLFFTWNLLPNQLAWSLVHGLVMSLAGLLAYAIVIGRLRPEQPWSSCWGDAGRLWALQLLAGLPVFLTAIDYGRWLAMLFCSGILSLCLVQPRPADPVARATEPGVAGAGARLRGLGVALATLELVVLPAHCCTYGPRAILAAIPYAAASQWKALALGWLGQRL